MKAAAVVRNGVIEYGDFEEPAARPDAAVVTVRAAALTNLDIAVAEGRHYLSPDAWPFVLGREAVAEAENGARYFFNAVSLVPPFGSMAERTLARIENGLPVPPDVPDVMAAALGNAGLAAWLPLSWRARLKPGESVLILGATGTSGLIAVAAAKLLGAARMVAAGRNPAALAEAVRLGADAVVHLDGSENLSAALRAAAAETDVVLDYLNGAAAEAALGVMATGGRMVQIGSMLAPGIHLPAQLARRQSLDVLGFAYYHAPISEQIDAYRELCRHALSGRIRIAFDSMPLSAIATAWTRQKQGHRTRQVLIPTP